jgi:hypothetical protein
MRKPNSTVVNFAISKRLQNCLKFLGILMLLQSCRSERKDGEHLTTDVKFSTSDQALQEVYDLAEKKCLEHLADFHGYHVIPCRLIFFVSREIVFQCPPLSFITGLGKIKII